MIGRGWSQICLQGAAWSFALCAMVTLDAAEQGASLEQVFESHYQQLLQRVEAGELSPQTKDKAKALWLGLRKDLVDLDAEVERLKLDVLSDQGIRQEAVLDKLGQKIAERERRLMRAVQNLDQLAGRETSAIPMFSAPPQALSPEPTRAQDKRAEAAQKAEKPSENSKEQVWDIEIEFAPEDLTKGDME